jgi:exopolysaccharide biosynthesis polyprenyl glycosylphosphotransferase
MDQATTVATASLPAGRHRDSATALRALAGTGGPAATTMVALALTGAEGAGTTIALVAAAGLASALLCRPLRRHAAQLPLMRHLHAIVGAALSAAALGLTGVLDGTLPLVVALTVMCAAAVPGSVLARRPLVRARKQGRGVRRVAVVGTNRIALAIGQELADAPEHGYVLAGRIAPRSDDAAGALGTLMDAERLVVEHDIDLIVLAPEAATHDIVEAITQSCLDLPVRMVDLSCFCERLFGHVPVTELHGAWFRFFMHPSFKRDHGPVKRALDVAVAAIAAVFAAPLIALFALLIRRDGGPAFFVQERIGEGGRAFRMYKMRTMRNDHGAPATWTTARDPRVTPIGRFLRKTHLDELPQVLNVLKGDMSLVGPRPEQPSYVAQLEQEVPHYSRRHLIRPGVTGWAQVRCGYAGTADGARWKMCHDLYYVKHRSVALDLLIIGETVRALIADRQYPDDDAAMSAFVRPGLRIA